MNNGKEVCKRLKKVRREIAEANDITLIQEECKHKGDCQGTCPKCEQEVRFLEGELVKRSKLGKAVSIIGIAAVTGTIALTSASCERAHGGEPPVEALGGMPMPEEYYIPEADLPTDITTEIQ